MMTHWDVSQIADRWSPADANSHELGPEWIEIAGFSVKGNGFQWVNAGHQPLHEYFELADVLYELGVQDRFGLVGIRGGSRFCDE